MKIVFCGSFYDMSKYDNLKQKSKMTLSLADSNLINKFIYGLYSNQVEDLRILNVLPIPSYPTFSQIIFYKKDWKLYDEVLVSDIGFINLPIIKHITRIINTFLFLRKEINLNPNVKVIVYDLNVSINIAIKILKMLKYEAEYTIILPDIPTEISNKELNSSWKQRMVAKIKKLFIDQFQYYSFITKQMIELVNLKGKKYVVIEGIYHEQDHAFELNKVKEKNIIFYSGQLNNLYKFDILLEAFDIICRNRDDFELWICGDGNFKQDMINASKKNSSIKYFGYLSTKEVKKLENQATLMINPRQNIGNLTKYSFPSKTMDYLASGKPVVGYALEGIPEEYLKYLNIVEGDDAVALANKLIEVSDLPQEIVFQKGIEARNFVLNEKDPKKMTRKIINMYEGR